MYILLYCIYIYDLRIMTSEVDAPSILTELEQSSLEEFCKYQRFLRVNPERELDRIAIMELQDADDYPLTGSIEEKWKFVTDRYKGDPLTPSEQLIHEKLKLYRDLIHRLIESADRGLTLEVFTILEKDIIDLETLEELIQSAKEHKLRISESVAKEIRNGIQTLREYGLIRR